MYPLECLHSSSEAGALGVGYAARQLIAEGVIHVWLEAFFGLSRLSADTQILDVLYLATAIRKYLLDLFIQARLSARSNNNYPAGSLDTQLAS